MSIQRPSSGVLRCNFSLLSAVSAAFAGGAFSSVLVGALSAAAATTGLALASATPAAAQFFGFYEPPPRYYRPYSDRRGYRSREVRRERPREAAREKRKVDPVTTDDKATAEVGKSGPQQMTFAIVSLADQHIKVYGGDGLIARSRVSSGQPGFETPTGIFGILEKNRDHESNIYEGAEMPFMQRLTWSGIALHQGVVPRRPASHGCIRLPAAFAARLWDMTKLGARVVVSSSDVTPVEMTHARLPVARMATAENLGLPADAKGLDVKVDASQQAVRVATADGTADIPDGGRRYNPIEAAGLLKAHAQAQARLAAKTADLGRSEARAAASAANEAAEAVRHARADLEDARGKGEPADKLADLERRLADAEARDAVLAPKALQTALVVRDAERSAEAAREAIAEANRRTAPLSVLISSKEGLVIVKQGKKPVYEAPFALRDPGQPLGTHLFVATAAQGGEGELRWSAMTIAGERPGRKTEPAAAPTAQEALDRITLTADTIAKLSELIWVGGSIIVTDRGVSPDFGEHTDMVVAIP